MATRSKTPKRQKTVNNQQAGSSQQPVAGQSTGSEGKNPPAAQPAPGGNDAPTIRKGIYLSALIYAEGEQAAPEDFAATATAALKDALGEAFKTNPGGLNMTLKKVEVQNDVEQEDIEEEKFQF